LNSPNSNVPAVPSTSGATPELGSFEFHGDLITVVTTDIGNWAVLGQLCQNLTLDSEGQRQAIARKSWSQGRTCVMQVQLPGDTQARPQFLIHERIVPMWLANITTSRIADDDIRGKVERAQVELADALYAYASKRSPIRREPSKLEVARDLVAALEAKEALEAANRVLAPKASKWDQFCNAEGLIGMTALADVLGTHVRGLTEFLVQENIFRKQQSRFGSNTNMPRRGFQQSGDFAVKLESNGKVSYEVAYATPKGADLIADMWTKRAAA
jgi:phage antirepressor YoqD-like protein